MRRRLSEYGLFFRQVLTNYHTTGAILPSGRFLASALTWFVGNEHAGPRRILEVGPGTGAVTQRIVAALGPHDQLDLVELNESFVGRLRHRFQNEAAFQAVVQRARADQEVPVVRPLDRHRQKGRPALFRPAGESIPVDNRFRFLLALVARSDCNVASPADLYGYRIPTLS